MPTMTLRLVTEKGEETIREYRCDWPGLCQDLAVTSVGLSEFGTLISFCSNHLKMYAEQGESEGGLGARDYYDD